MTAMARETTNDIVVDIAGCVSRPPQPASEVTSGSFVAAHRQAGITQRLEVGDKLRHQRRKLARIHAALAIAAPLLRVGHRRPPLVAMKTAREASNYAELGAPDLGLAC